MINNEPLVDEREAADFFNLKPQTLAVWRLKGIGPKFFKLGRAIKYAPSELRAYLERHRCQSTAEAESLSAN